MGKGKTIQKYYLWSISDRWIWITITVAFLSFVWAIVRYVNQFQDMQFFIAAILFCISLLGTIIRPIVKNTKAIKKAYDQNLLWEALGVFLKYKDYHKDSNNRNNDNRFKYIQLLKEACDLPYIRANLDLDGRPYDEFYNMMGAISVTATNISAWKYPEFSWFLVSQYAASLYKQYYKKMQENNSNISLYIEDRYDDQGETPSSINSNLNDNYKHAFDYSTFTRVYLLTRKEFEENKSMIEQFVAGHMLFGINIYIIDIDYFLSDGTRKSSYEKMIESLHNKNYNTLHEHEKILDIMCYKKGKRGKIFYTQIDPSTHNVVEVRLENKASSVDDKERPLHNWGELVKVIKDVIKNRPLCLLYPNDKYEYTNKEYRMNKNKSFLIFK